MTNHINKIYNPRKILNSACEIQDTLGSSGKFTGDNSLMLDEMAISKILSLYMDLDGDVEELKSLFKQSIKQFEKWGLIIGTN